MIEKVAARSGHTVLRWQDRLLASAVNPEREAREWLERREALVRDVKSIFVLGLGAGYHVNELLKQTNARILVIDNNSDVIHAASELHDWNDERLSVESVNSAARLRGLESVRSSVCESFVVFRYAPSVALDPDFYNDCEKQLVARDWGNLTWQWKLKGLPSLDANPRVENQAQPLTIYDLEQTELVQHSEERQRMLIKALRELVK